MGAISDPHAGRRQMRGQGEKGRLIRPTWAAEVIRSLLDLFRQSSRHAAAWRRRRRAMAWPVVAAAGLMAAAAAQIFDAVKPERDGICLYSFRAAPRRHEPEDERGDTFFFSAAD